MMNKRGSARDIILITVLVFAMAIGTFVAHFMTNTAADEMLKIDQINSSEKTVEALEAYKSTSARYDQIVFGVFIGLCLALMITSWFVGGNPIFMFIYFIIVVIGVAVSAIKANTWEQVSQASIFGNTVTAFPLTNNLMSYWPVYIAVVGLVGLIVMFGKAFIMPEE